MKKKVILAIDQGTTGSRAILYDQSGRPVSSAYQEFRQYYPRPGWVEHDPDQIWRSCRTVIRNALEKAALSASSIEAIGITNQRESTVLWDRTTGRPVHPAIVWQDRRTSDLCQSLIKKGHEHWVRKRTGLVIDPYFSATKIDWLLRHIPGLLKKVSQGRIAFGTVDTWLLWNLTGGRSHKTDLTNASRTLLLNIQTKKWDPQLLKLFHVSESLLPDVCDSASDFGRTVKQGFLKSGIPIFALVGDQQAALYGQGCYRPGETKNTYGTGCFLVTNMGPKYHKPPFGLLATLACDRYGKSVYALEGAVFIAGAAIQWLRDGMQFFTQSSQSESMALRVKDSGGVTVIPAFTGLGSPYWKPHVMGAISGITRGTRREHIIRATLEAIAHQTADVVDCVEKNAGRKISALKVDGGATRNRFLMQFQADILGIPIKVSSIAESTAWGAAKLAAVKSGFWVDPETLDANQKYEIYYPRLSFQQRARLRSHWLHEIAHHLTWQ